MMSVTERKAALRLEILHRRDAWDTRARSAASGAIRSRLAVLAELRNAVRLAAFWPLGSEVDLRPFLEQWCAMGKIAALPAMTGDTLRFLRWSKGAALVRKPFGVMEPEEDADEVFPEIILVPLVAFDRTGGRLGYGKGFYDRALAARRGAAAREASTLMTIGVAFAMQEVASLPLEAHDMGLDAIVTEAELVRATG